MMYELTILTIDNLNSIIDSGVGLKAACIATKIYMPLIYNISCKKVEKCFYRFSTVASTITPLRALSVY